MNALFFFLLSIVLTADGLMTFLIPVAVYKITGSVEYSGLSYFMWWLPRLALIPLLGGLIDKLGIRPLSILSDCIKIAGCSFLVVYKFDHPAIAAIAFGVVGSIISIGNSQTMIGYEKIVSLLSENKAHHANVISRLDFLGMVIGPMVGMALLDFGYSIPLAIASLFYFLNAIFFVFVRINESLSSASKAQGVDLVLDRIKRSVGFVIATPIIVGLIFLSVGNNMFDGLIESSGAAIIEKNMHLPIKYFGLVDIAAGLCGVLGTYIYGNLFKRVDRSFLMMIGIVLIVIPSIVLTVFSSFMWIFISCYALSIVGKVFSGNISRLLRIELIPIENFAGTSSFIVLLGQSVLPIVGVALYFFGEKPHIITILLGISVLASLTAGMFVFRSISATQFHKASLE
ncbi:MFS transporter [Burkholderia stabilis]|uniref:MFS transporter n=1 Tax=Burkholderia stabilis TaxID=95485 RepID=UPI0015916268|nr:MFS transporter [Burkholderia stabilis]